MKPPALRCAKCHRSLVHVGAWLAGLPLGRTCAIEFADAIRRSPTPIEEAAERDRAAAVRASQLALTLEA